MIPGAMMLTRRLLIITLVTSSVIPDRHPSGPKRGRGPKRVEMAEAMTRMKFVPTGMASTDVETMEAASLGDSGREAV